MSKSERKRDVQMVPLSKIIDPPKHLIARNKLGDISALTKDIKRRGVMSSVFLRPSPTRKGFFEILAGHRRRASAKAAGLTEIPAQIALDMDNDLKAMAAVWAENDEGNRSNLLPIEQAKMFKRMVAEAKKVGGKGSPIVRVAKLCNVSDEMVRRTLRLLEAPESIQKKLASGDISKDVAIHLMQTAPEVQKELTRAIDRGEIGTTKELRRYAVRVGQKKQAEGKASKPKDKRKVIAPRHVWMTPAEMNEMYETLLGAYIAVADDDDKSGQAVIRRNQLAVCFCFRGMQDAIETESKQFAQNLETEVARYKAERAEHKNKAKGKD